MEKIDDEFLDSVTKDLNNYIYKNIYNKSLEELGISFKDYNLENIFFSDIIRINYLYKLKRDNEISDYELKEYLKLYERYLNFREKLISIRDENQISDSYYDLLMDQYNTLTNIFSSLGLFSLKIEIDNLFNIDEQKYTKKK